MTGRNVGMRRTWFKIQTVETWDGKWTAFLKEYIGALNRRTGNSFTKFLALLAVAEGAKFPTRLDALRAARQERQQLLGRQKEEGIA